MTREEAIDRLKEARAGHKEYLSVEALNMAIKALEQEPKTGHWIKSLDSYGNNHFICPFCEHDIATKADTLGDNYCSNCGAKLQESEGKE